LTLDDRFRPEVLDELRDRGHEVHVQPGRRWGRNCAARKSGRVLSASASTSTPLAIALGR
jgi:hypothetical protein